MAAVSMMIVWGRPTLLPGTTLGMNSIGYAARVFSVFAFESRLSRREWTYERHTIVIHEVP